MTQCSFGWIPSEGVSLEPLGLLSTSAAQGPRSLFASRSAGSSPAGGPPLPSSQGPGRWTAPWWEARRPVSGVGADYCVGAWSTAPPHETWRGTFPSRGAAAARGTRRVRPGARAAGGCVGLVGHASPRAQGPVRAPRP